MKLVTLLVLLLSLPSMLLAKKFVSSEQRATLIELYTSEGCSSCPPAERQMNSLMQHSDLWGKFVPIAFHVDYWNDLGWTDPFSQSQFTARQRSYARFWKVNTTYTPAFVNNAKSVKSRMKLGDKGEKSTYKKAPKLTVELDKNQKIKIKATGIYKKKSYEAHIAILGNGFVSKIPEGENKGETLKHNFVVMSYQKVSLNRGSASTKLVKIRSKKRPKSKSIAVWLTHQGEYVPLQSLGGHL